MLLWKSHKKDCITIRPYLKWHIQWALLHPICMFMFLHFCIVTASQRPLISPSVNSADAEGLTERRERTAPSVVEMRSVWGKQANKQAGLIGAGLMTASSTAPHLTDSIRYTDDGALRAAGLLSCCLHFAHPLPDTCSEKALSLIRVLELFFSGLFGCVCVCVFSLGCPLFIFCEYWAVGSRWSLFSRKSEQEWTDYAASLVNTRNGYNWTKVANPGSFLDSIFAVLMAKHLPNLGLTHLQVGALSR